MNNASLEITDLPSPDGTAVAFLDGREAPTTSRGTTDSAPAIADRNPARATKNDKLRTRLLAGAAGLAAVLGLGVYYMKCVAPYESTDDAFVDADVTSIVPQASGRVTKLLVADNQVVARGAVLFEIDPSDYRTRLDQARAELAAANGRVAQAEAQSTVDQAKVEQERANIVAAEAEARLADADFRRYTEVGTLGVSESRIDLAATQAKSSTAALAAARNRLQAVVAQTRLDRADIGTARAEMQKSEAAVRQAELDLSYTRVVAPVSGYVTHRAAAVGSYVQVGQPVLAIVPRKVWVVANFKETQLARMRPGQPVTVKVDAYPGVAFAGRVDSLQAGTGARFSLLPPENASGNYVKVVQRVPVKITLDDGTGASRLLGPGMSVVPEVRVR